MIRIARALDALAIGLGAALLFVLATGELRVAALRITRAEDVLVALASILGIRSWLRPFDLPRVQPSRLVTAGVLGYAVAMSFIVLTRHRALLTHALDLGYYVQVVWNSAAGHGPRVTLPPMHAWGDHLSPIMTLFVPAALVWPGAGPLLLAQTLILAAGGLATFAFARHRLGDQAAASVFAILYLLNPSLHGINIRDVHPQAFVIPLVIAAALAVDTRRYGWCAVALLAALACREDAAIAVVGFGLWLGFARGRWLAGFAIALGSLGLLAFDLRILMPYFRGEPYPHLHRWAHLGTSLGDILVSLALRPWRWLPVVLTVPKLLYGLAMLAPLGFLPLLAPGALVAALPGLAMNLVSLDPVLFHHRSQYQSFVLPFLVLAAVEGYRQLGSRQWLPSVREREGIRPWVPSAVTMARVGLVLSVVLTARTINDLTVTRWRLGSDQRAAYELMARIPRSAAVSVHERLVPHLATRPSIFVFPTGIPDSVYVLARADARARVPAEYTVVSRSEPWVLWRRADAP